MKDLGMKPVMYDSPTSMPEAPQKNYPKVRLPIKVVGDKWSIGDNVMMEFEAVVTGIVQDEYSNEVTFELQKGDFETMKEEKAEGGKDK